MTADHDLFISYRRADAARLEPLLTALVSLGVRVWCDTQAIEDFRSVQQSVGTGLGRARAMLVWYSADYNASRACQWELTAAYLAAQADPATAGDPRRRLLVINPEPGNGHIHLPELFDQQWLPAPGAGDDAAVQALAQRICGALAVVPPTPLGDLRALTPPRWLPHQGTGSTRFVGRLREMWQLHGVLQAGEAAMLTGSGGKPGLAQVRGAGGIGKSLLAEEYALRFGAAYPGGVFWLRAYGYTDSERVIGPDERNALRDSQLIDLAARLGLPISGLSVPQVVGLLGHHLGRSGEPFLWVVDDLPPELGQEGLAPWLAPHPLGRSLLTTRARRFNHVHFIELPQLDEDEALHLLTRGKPIAAADEPVAREICRELGHHALAIDVAAALVERRGYVAFLASLHREDRDALELAATGFSEALPNGHERSIASTLLASINELDEPARDLLRLASVLAAAPIPRDLIWRTIARADLLDGDDAQDLTDPASTQLESCSLAEITTLGALVVHTLVLRTIHFHDVRHERVSVLLAAAVGTLLCEMPRVKDIREHMVVDDWVAHARETCANPWNVESAQVLGWVANYHFVRGQYIECIRIIKHQVQRLHEILGVEHVAVLEANCLLGSALRRHGKLAEARCILDNIFGSATRQLGPIHPLTIRILGGLAATLWSQGLWQDAKNLQVVVKDILLLIPGGQGQGMLTVLSNLAVTMNSCGGHEEARKLHEYVSRARKESLGGSHQDTLISKSCLALVLREQQDLVGAERLQKDALVAMTASLGERHHDTLTLKNNYAVTLSLMDKRQEAKALLEDVAEYRLSENGELHPETLSTLSGLADCLTESDDSERHWALREKIYENSRISLGGEHPDTLSAMTALAIVVRERGDVFKATSLLRVAIRRFARTLGVKHDQTIMCAVILMGILKEQGWVDQSEMIYFRYLSWLVDPGAFEFGFHTRGVAEALKAARIPRAPSKPLINYQFKLIVHTGF